MTDHTNRPTITPTGLITGAIALTLPFIADRLIVAAISEVKDASIGSVIGMAAYTAAPFLLLDSAMRPRRRVRLALWMGLALTALVWAAFAQTGHAFQNFAETASILRESCTTLKETTTELSMSDVDRLEAECATYKSSGNAHTGLYILTMIWPALLIGIMGAAAKIGEPEIGDENHDA
jgi:hypothetical protein